jgi:uncharacterized membrane protein YgaE (UPF0421/DUF939 family)
MREENRIASPAVTPAFQLSVRTGISTALAFGLATFFQLPYPLYALISALLVTDLSPSRTRQLAFCNLAGSVLGAVVGAVCISLLPSASWSIGLGIFIALFLSHLLHVQDAAKITALVCIIVMLYHGDRPWLFSLYRLMETMLGIGIAVLASFVPKVLPIDRWRRHNPSETKRE